MITSGRITEDQLIHAMAAFAKRKSAGDLEGWGLAGFAKHIEKFKAESVKSGIVYLICENCKAEKKVPASARNDYRHCSLCSGMLVMMNDQAGAKRMDEWKRPPNDSLPTIEQLDAVCRNNVDKNPSLARIALAQIEAGAFRGAPKNVVSFAAAASCGDDRMDDPFAF